ncbi:MAG TPA: Calx-beta domain-containing protein, partial [Thermoanaerobaculia bacterium]|nr:Calx-beta domain-containing protein [Thermoanaerobaculia bacterium]
MLSPTTIAAVLALALAPAIFATDHAVSVENNFFTPKTITIQPGDSVTWTNNGGGFHNVKSEDGSFTSGAPSTSQWTFTQSFSSAGTYPYYCQVHGGPGGVGMAGTVIVGSASNPGTLAFSRTSYSVSEGGGNVQITVTRTGGDDGAASVHYATGDGSAHAGNDYTGTSGTLNWGDKDSASKSFSIPIINNTKADGNRVFSVHLSSASGASLGSPANGSVTIIDDDSAPASPGALQFAQAQSTVSEAAGAASLQVDRVGGSDGTVSVIYDTSDGSAKAGTDYTAVHGTLSWGDQDSAPKSVSVPIAD